VFVDRRRRRAHIARYFGAPMEVQFLAFAALVGIALTIRLVGHTGKATTDSI